MSEKLDSSRCQDTPPGLNLDFTPEERAANGRKGGVASGIAKRKQRTFRESIKAIMALQTPDEEKRQVLEALGVDPTVLNAINLAVSGKAAAGDVEAARYLRDTAGEKPREGLEIGNLDDKPLASLDMSKLTDEQLRVIAARRSAEPSGADRMERSEDERSTAERGADQSETE